MSIQYKNIDVTAENVEDVAEWYRDVGPDLKVSASGTISSITLDKTYLQIATALGQGRNVYIVYNEPILTSTIPMKYNFVAFGNNSIIFSLVWSEDDGQVADEVIVKTLYINSDDTATYSYRVFGQDVVVDSDMSSTSTNPVQNKVVKAYVDEHGGSSTDYTNLTNKPQINNITLSGNKTLNDLGVNVPTKTTQLINDSGYITFQDVSNKEDKSNKITHISDGMYDPLQYPNVIAVYNYVEEKVYTCWVAKSGTSYFMGDTFNNISQKISKSSVKKCEIFENDNEILCLDYVKKTDSEIIFSKTSILNGSIFVEQITLKSDNTVIYETA